MKKIITSAIIAAFALLFSSCEKGTIEAETEVTRGRVVEISASMPETKVSVATTGKVTWSEGDQIAAFNTAGTKFEFDLVDGAGTTSGLFRCNSFEGDLGQTAVYPASYAEGEEAAAAEAVAEAEKAMETEMPEENGETEMAGAVTEAPEQMKQQALQ